MIYTIDLYELSNRRSMVNTFGGLNNTFGCGENEFRQMENMTGDYFPALSPRSARGEYANAEGATALIGKDALCWVKGGSFFINSYEIPMDLSSDPAVIAKRQLVSMGAWVVIFPDKKRVNTIDHSWGSLESHYETLEQVEFHPCTLTGQNMDYVKSPAPPEDTTKAWIDTTASPVAMKIYSAATESWVAVVTPYTRIEAHGIDRYFEKFDAVNIIGVEDPKLADLNGWHPIWEKGEDYIVVVGLCPGTFQQQGIKAERTLPDMDFVVESKNRLWGCKYGMVDGKVVNEIYASKLGDPTNWNCVMGISTDSQVISCGTDGPWTGAVAMDTPLFFKEDWLHRIYGNGQPYGVQITALSGVQKGCHKSLALVGSTLFYKARGGVMAYDGSLPTKVSEKLGNERYTDAVAGSVGSKYYISMKDAAGQNQLFVFDASKGLWHREDTLDVSGFCTNDDQLYAVTDGKVITMLGGGTANVKWYAVTGNIGADDPDQKYLSRLTLRVRIPVGARLRISVCYDSTGVWESVAELTGRDMRSFALPVKCRRCDHLQLKLEGVGDVKLFAITKTMEQGSEIT